LTVFIPKSTYWLSTTAPPASLPPVTSPATAPGIPFCSKTLEIILVTAMEQSGVVADGFQRVAFPAARDRARFLTHRVRYGGNDHIRAIYHPYTATGKLKADITPTTPKGLGTGDKSQDGRLYIEGHGPSRMVCPGLSEATTLPFIILDKPTP
jgi:hypothetical protein